MDEPCIYMVNYTFSRNMHSIRVMIDYENKGIRDIIMHSLLDIEEIRFFGNGVTNSVISRGKPRVRPGSNAFL